MCLIGVSVESGLAQLLSPINPYIPSAGVNSASLNPTVRHSACRTSRDFGRGLRQLPWQCNHQKRVFLRLTFKMVSDPVNTLPGYGAAPRGQL